MDFMMSSGDRKTALRWSAQRRLRFIEFRLYWQGRLNRKDLTEYFRISEQQASADIALYQKAAPGNCEYDRNEKTYVLGASFTPRFGVADAQGYLNELRSVDYGITRPEESWIGEFPDFGAVPYPKRSVDSETLRSVLRGIERREALEIRYQSLSRPKPIWRWITPHALGYDGHRWHARAFCHRRGDFRDFVLGRIFDIRSVEAHQIEPSLDVIWSETVKLVIGTYPGLPGEQRRAVEIDYKMTRGRLKVPVRLALAHYLMRWMRVDLDPDVVDAEQIQIVLMNRNEVEDRKKQLEKSIIETVANYGVPRFSSESRKPRR